MILLRHFEQRMAQPGFYVDVGALHPYRFSNTYLFYRSGWRGINIEPNPAAITAFRQRRPLDVTVNCAVGPAGEMTYYMFGEPALNTVVEAQAQRVERETGGKFRIETTVVIPVRPLAAILDDHVAPDQTIDFMTVDAEGFDIEVLRSNDWSRFRPELLLTEISGVPLHAAPASEVAVYLDSVGYDLIGKAVQTAFFRRR